MSEEKIINIDAAKSKFQEAKSKAITETSEKLQEATLGIKERANSKREIVMSNLVDKGIEMTEKQLGFLQKFKKKVKKKKSSKK